nr:FAD-dependent oxidoreductase [Pseudomonadota bacterium]
DTAIIAVGQTVKPGILGEASKTPEGRIVTDEKTMATSIKGIYAGGDLVNGGATAVRAVGDGKTAALAMDEYIRKKRESEVSSQKSE